MNYVEKLLDGVQSVMKLNPSTFSGAVDIVVVNQADGTLRSTPWHVRFGKIHLLNPAEQKVHVYVNGQRVKGIKMKLGTAGEAYFLHEDAALAASGAATTGLDQGVAPVSVGPLSTAALSASSTISPDVSDTETDSLRASAEFPPGAGDSQSSSTDAIGKETKFENTVGSADSGDASSAGGGRGKNKVPSYSSSPASQSSPVGSPPVAGSQLLLDGQGSGDQSQQSGSRWSWGWGSLPKRSKEAQTTDNVKDTKPNTASEDSDRSLSPSPSERHGVIHRPRSSSFDSGTSLRAVKSDDAILSHHQNTTQASTSAESANTTPIAQDPNAPPNANPQSGSWSSSVGSWFALFKKPKKSGSEPVVPAELHSSKKMITNASGETREDEYDRNLVIHDFSSKTGALGDQDDEDDDEDESRFVDAADDLETPRAPGAVPVNPASKSAAATELEFADSMSEPGISTHVVDMGSYNSGNGDDTIFEMDEQVDAPKMKSSASADSVLIGSIKTPPRSPEKSRRPLHVSSAVNTTVSKGPEPVLPELSALRDFNLEVSKCGNIIFNPDYVGDDVKTAEAFKQNIVTYEKLSADPNLIFHPDMVFRVENKLYPWAVAAPYLVGLFAFQRRLDANVMEQHYTKWKEANTKSSGSVWTRWLPRGWRRQETSSVPATPVKGAGPDSVVKTSSSNSLASSRSESKPQLAVPPGTPNPVVGASFDDDDEESESGTDPYGNKITYTKSLKPLPEQLAALNLQPGKNKIQFKVKSSKTKGSFAEVTSNVFLWESNVKIVVSDIDGTITKTDVFGQIFPVFGKDWSHIGVAELFSNIKANGYQVLYLTARSIGAASITKEYLASLKQESGHTLPDGPVFMSPDRLLNALNREVILRKPEQFKIACLSDIKNLFPPGSYPFYAGFGNRHTDAVSYVAVSIPKAKIFIINPQGEIECASKSVRRSYTKINELVEQMFPPYHINVATKPQAEEEWNDFNYWKSASSLSVSIDDIEAALKPSK
eukprot:TRINITY_DN5787_c0_g2_i1.p1 TRINITY_DN5787_c0_g2~~TRINITY_DN5787_c0_g2_i1.p1  ORF type:complete len:1000 (+),score=212.58 TRINITY_DN5787_c0_g2_i1:90-3089(+)